LIQAAMAHPGFAFLDVLSPCVTFNNQPTSTKSYDFVRAHMEATATIDFVPERDEITVDYPAGDAESVTLHDGSQVLLRKLAPHWDPRDRHSAQQRLTAAKAEGEILTGLLYIDTESQELHTLEQTVATPLNRLTEAELLPGAEALEGINAGFR
jgi:2-oxoglutarate ferredoxin oxidoreductase subunit beta